MPEKEAKKRREHQIIPLPNGRFAVRYGLGHRQKRKYKTLPKSITTKTAAKKELQKLLARVEAENEHASPVTISALCDVYLDLHKQSDSARVRARGIIETHIKPVLGSIIAEKLRLTDVLRWRNERQNPKDEEAWPASNGTADREWTVLRAVLLFGVRSDLIATMPIKKKAVDKLTSPADGRVIYFDAAEWQLFIHALDDERGWKAYVGRTRSTGTVSRIGLQHQTERTFGFGRDPESDATAEYRNRLLAYKPIFSALLLTGCRLGEITGLTWQDVDMKGGYLRIPQPKTAKPKTIPISSELRAELESRPRGVGRAHVFPREDGTKHSNLEVQRAFRVYRDCAGIRDELTPHALRHTFASWLVIAGVPIRTVQELLGHKTLAMTLRYAHLAPVHLTGAMVKLEAMKNGTEPIGNQSTK